MKWVKGKKETTFFQALVIKNAFHFNIRGLYFLCAHSIAVAFKAHVRVMMT